MRKTYLSLLFLFILTASALAQQSGETTDRSRITLRAGYSIGGTVPLGFPEELRQLRSYAPKFTYRVGADINLPLCGRWGLLTGLYLEQKGFKGDVALRQFDVILRQGIEEITGPYTGNVVINIRQTGITLPLQATWQANNRLMLKAGPYVSFITGRSFYGYAYGETGADGKSTAYLRRGEVRGDLVYVGNDENTKGYFSGDTFDNFLRQFQWGFDMGIDWYFHRRWGVFADVSYGFNSAFNSDEGNPVTMGLHPLYGTFGFIYKIGH